MLSHPNRRNPVMTVTSWKQQTKLYIFIDKNKTAAEHVYMINSSIALITSKLCILQATLSFYYNYISNMKYNFTGHKLSIK